MKGFAALPLVLLLVAVTLISGGIYMYSNKNTNTEIVSSPSPVPVEIPIASATASPSAIPTSTPQPTIAPTKKPTPVPTLKPTATPAPQATGPSCPSSDQKADLVVNVQGNLAGETTITVSCGGSVKQTQVIPSGGRSVTFYGYSVGTYKVKASNSGRSYDYDMEIKAGSPPLNFNFPE